MALDCLRAAEYLDFQSCQAVQSSRLQLIMKDEIPVAAGIAWYRREQWQLLLSLIPDPEVFPHTYDEWLTKATKTLQGLSRAGVDARKVDVEVGAMLRWAEEQGRSPDGGARAEYATYLLNKGDDASNN